MKTIQLPFLLGLAAIVLGCQTADSTQTSAVSSMADAEATRRVQTSLTSGYGYNYPSVIVSTLNGTVTLTGFVQTEQQKDYAEELARSQRGVDRVVNLLTVQETPRSYTPVPRDRGWGGDEYLGY